MVQGPNPRANVRVGSAAEMSFPSASGPVVSQLAASELRTASDPSQTFPEPDGIVEIFQSPQLIQRDLVWFRQNKVPAILRK